MAINIQQIFDKVAESTIKTLQVMCKTEATQEDAYEKGVEPALPFDIAGLIGITSATARGSVGIYFQKEIYLELLTQMLGESVTKIDKTNEDAAAELMNIIFGDAKLALNQQGHNIQMAIPNVLRGGKMISPESKLQKMVVIPIKTKMGRFFLEFALNPLKDSEKIKDSKSRTLTNADRAAFFKPFVDGTIGALKVQCGIDASPGSPSAKTSSDSVSYDIAGFIGITSESLNGSYTLSFKKDVYLKLVSKMLGEEFTELPPGLEDAVAELLNIILGSAKVVLNDQQGHSIQMALPTLIYGDTIRSNTQAGKTTIVIPFYSDVGRFNVEVTMS